MTSHDYYNNVIADAPVGYWRLGEKSGSIALDSTPTGTPNPGTYQGSAVLGSQGALAADPDGALRNDSAHVGEVDIPHAANQAPSALTIECWTTMPGTAFTPQTNSAPLVKTSLNMHDGYGFYFVPGSIRFYVNDLGAYIAAPIPAGIGAKTNENWQSRFHHLVGTFDGAQMSFYLDGVLVKKAPYAAPLNASTGPLVIGRGFGTNLWWAGKVDEVAIYDRVLDETRVRAHYQAGIAAAPIDEVHATGADPTSDVYGQAIQVSTDALKQIAGAELADWLYAMTGKTFPVTTTPTPTTQPAIKLIKWCDACNPSLPYTTSNPTEQALLADLATRDLLAFYAISDPTTNDLKLVARSDAGLNMAAAYYRRLLGARWILPNERWKFTTPRDSIRWHAARVEGPELKWGTDFVGTGGFVGRGTPDPTNSVSATWAKWKRSNFLMGGLAASEQLLSWNQSHILPTDPNDTMGSLHPLWRAWKTNGCPPDVNGGYCPVDVKGGSFGWHIANNPDFQNYFAASRLATLAANVAADPSARSAFAISTEQPDGVAEDQSPDATSNGKNATDNVATLANAVADKIATQYSGKYAFFGAYSTHSAPPTQVVLRPNTGVFIVPNLYQYNALPDVFVQQWAQRAPNIVVSPDWSLTEDWKNKPALDPFTTLPGRIRFYRANNIQSISAMSTESGGAAGLAWYMAGNFGFNTKTLDQPFWDDVFDLAFGPLPQPGADGGVPDSPQREMRDMLTRWATGFSLEPNEIGRSLRNVEAAICDPHASAQVKARVGDFAAYVHFLKLLYENQAAPTDVTKNELVNYIWSIHSRGMVQTWPIMDSAMSHASPAVKAAWDQQVPPFGPAWTQIPADKSDEELCGLMTADREHYQVLFEAPTYSSTLKPAPNAPAPNPANTWVSRQMIGQDVTGTFYAKTAGSIQFQLYPSTGPTTITITGPSGPVYSGTFTGGWTPIPPQPFTTCAGCQYTMTIASPSKSGFGFEVAVPETIPFVFTGNYWSTDKGSVPLTTGTPHPASYFYVPAGTENFVVHTPSHSVRPSVFRLNAQGSPEAITTCSVESCVVTNPAQYRSTSAIWYLTDFKTASPPLRLMGVPSNFALSPAQLLIPSNVN